ncbi:hypothetical protein HDU92_009067 [Lobulomyces angularis]|nr:hypothetical protein HDU92_009067 [Lobulomyces angularis]
MIALEINNLNLLIFSSCVLLVVLIVSIENVLIFFKVFKKVSRISVLAFTMFFSAFSNCLSVYIAINKETLNIQFSSEFCFNLWLGIIWVIMVVSSFDFFMNRFVMLNVNDKKKMKFLYFLYALIILTAIYTLPVFMLYTVGLRSSFEAKIDEIIEVLIIFLCETLLSLTFLFELKKKTHKSTIALETLKHIKISVCIIIILDIIAPLVLFLFGPFYCYQAKTFSYCVKAKLEMQMYQNIKKVIQKKNAHEIVNNASTEKANNSSKKNENESNFSSVQSSLLRFGNSNFSDSKVKVIENLDVKWEIDEKLASVVEEVV